VSTETISAEGGKNGIHQRYGLYLPQAYEAGTPTPLQYWLHFRGGEANTAANLVPRVFKHYGEDRDTIVVTPHARGSSSWYAGKGHVDFLEVWDDVLETVSVDQNRVYVSGHSMGGYGTYLLSTVYPDRFAAGMPVAGPPTQGMWTGVDFEGCDEMTFDEYSPCYVQANDGDARAQNTHRLLDNLRSVPLAIWHGTDDELVPVSGVTRQAAKLQELGYTYRYYVFPGYEHYSHPAMDEWAAGARYMHTFTRDPAPQHVTYVRDMRFERATEVSRSDGVPLDFEFDSAYWMSDLEPADAAEGVARFDATTGMRQRLSVAQAVPDSGSPAEFGTAGPFTIIGQRELSVFLPQDAMWNPYPSVDMNVTGAKSVQIDMRELEMAEFIDVNVTTDQPLEIALAGTYVQIPDVTGAEVVGVADGTLTVRVPEGTSEIQVRP
jgi:poly(3-hydroxybutyrate) depolymerase